MAFKLPAIFSKTDAKSRVIIIVVAVLALVGAVIVGSRYLGDNANLTGQAKVANAPANLQSVPGGQLSPEYYRALMQANAQATKQAQISGTSAVATLVNSSGQPDAAAPTGNCTVLCPGGDNVDAADDINNLVKLGKLSQDDANTLLNLAKNDVTATEYASALDDLVRKGKLTPEQARKLLESYKKQHENNSVSEGAKTMDALIKSGKLSLSVANDLLALQKKQVTPAEYAAELNRLVREGKISPAVAAQLLAQYTQQNAKKITDEAAAQINSMAKSGQITAEVAKDLVGMQQKNVPVDQYKAELDRLVAAGKLTPAQAAQMLMQYKKQRTSGGAASSVNKLLLGPNATPAMQAEAKKLLAMQANNISLKDYEAELKRAVAAGEITPEAAAQLMQEYQAAIAPQITTVVGPETDVPSSDDLTKLQQRLQEQQEQAAIPTEGPGGTTAQQFADARAQAAAEAERLRRQRIQDLMAGMSTQAQSLIAAWQPQTMQHKGGTDLSKKPLGGASEGSGSTIITKKTETTTGSKIPTTAPLIKAGTILFAVLDTAVDSDYPDTPVMATVVQGKFKGAKLLGKLALAKDQDRVSLNFTMLDKDDWLTTKPVTAFAMDPDTARTVLASNVNYHYMLRYGSMFASSFVTGYASAITSSGGTSTTGIFGTSSTNPQLSPAAKLAVGLGQVGTTLGTAMSSYFNTPATVKVNAGVGLGILFMADVPT